MGTSDKMPCLLGIPMCTQSCVSRLVWEGRNVQVQPQVNSQTNTVDKFISVTKLQRKGNE